MTARFVRLRIAGFKSFADPVSVEILPGLTGIVGPNGCGKSNVVEALRWVMGETNARALRGGEMDDLIFAGTTARAARNMAEVTLTLEGAAEIAPAPFTGQEELQVCRRAERGAGSGYRINGRTTRGRDVQTLFADLASGARSSAMVSQGRVSALVNARPEERRTILEEAAGITGLHGRRHEAELKLRATEANLARAEDLRLQLESRLGDLQEQSEQAARYRELSQGLRDSETALLALLHARAHNGVAEGEAGLLAARTDLKAAEEMAETAVLTDYEVTKALPALREQVDMRRTALERFKVRAETIAEELSRAEAALEQAQARLAECEGVHASALARRDDATLMLGQLEAERAQVKERLSALPALREAAQAACATLAQAMTGMAARVEEATTTVREAELQATQAREGLATATTAHERLATQHAALATEIAALEADMPTAEAIAAHDEQIRVAEEQAATALTAREDATRAHADATLQADLARNAATESQRVHAQATQDAATAASRLEALERDVATLGNHVRNARAELVPEDERTRLAQAATEAEVALDALRAERATAEEARTQATQAEIQANARLKEARATRNATEEALRAARAAHKRARDAVDTLTASMTRLRAQAVPDEALQALVARREAAAAALDSARQHMATVEAATVAATQEDEACTARIAEARASLSGLEAEADGLARALHSETQADPARGTTLADSLHVPAGLETALAVVLSDGLEAVVKGTAPRSWHDLPPATPAPFPAAGIEPLSAVLEAPPALSRALGAAGLLPDGMDGAPLQASLTPGQCLVTREGALWRWDGYTQAPNLPDRAALRLKQLGRLRTLRAELEQVRGAVPALEQAAQAATTTRQQTGKALTAARDARMAAENALETARTAEAELARQHATIAAQIDTLSVQQATAQAALTDSEAASTRAAAQEASLPDLDVLAKAHHDATQAATQAQTAEKALRARHQQAEAALEQARRALQAATTRHGEAETRLQALLPEQARLENDRDTARAARDTSREQLTALPAPALAEDAARQATAAATQAGQALEQARMVVEETTTRLEQARAARAALEQKMRETGARLEARQARMADLTDGLQQAQADVAAARARLEALPDMSGLEHALASLREQAETLRAQETEQRETLARLHTEDATLRQRFEASGQDMTQWTARVEAASLEAEAAETRLRNARAEHERVAPQPIAVRERRDAIATELARHEASHDVAMVELQQAETRMAEVQQGRRTAEEVLTAAREAVVRAEGRREQAQVLLAQLQADSTPPAGVVPADLSVNAETGLRRKVARLTRQRDELGPVNLRAELEAQEASGKIDTILHERDELQSAIARLRGMIGQLNREGRERLMAVFSQIDQHFQALFARMFNGGRAHLGMVGNDDPLQAGLEIYAQPPGKKLATLSLLSGGEQALTALSLIFAVFRCNPAPVCVLDEVDAPLDDANVGRFCALLADMVAEAGTRFLVVTHHQLTMAHMDRLYGVTMQERGVSRVLSVDLERATEMVDAEPVR
ncbi:AAA family ATPase [Komagataeibacter sucrofermentans]|uniref:Chromosome partition protein Smc n=1 Tax=Komagataeibacter sucrofermentans TaxID=1053551 RepID=A0A318QLD3_9PROT|nr:AAA family ATPase [Komagataeibacter sucrofermentans]PYD78321.1 chromosome segregation protein SMC [Komagataeibacter sucrofermentans]GBQ45799.1 chromosome segregation protein SMC [Komagataeibacter sucrofermentans DSM 15973]